MEALLTQLNLEEAARVGGIGKDTLRRWIQAGRISHYLLGSTAEGVFAVKCASATSQWSRRLDTVEGPGGSEFAATFPCGRGHFAASRHKATRCHCAPSGLNRWFIEPIVRGSYPENLLQVLGDKAPKVESGDMELITQPIDFLGLNYYYRIIQIAAPY